VGREISLERLRPGDWRVLAGKGDVAPGDFLVGQEALQRLRRQLSRLPPVYQQVIVLRVQQDMSFEEIAAVVGRSAAAARHLWSRGVKRLLANLCTPAEE
jgi:RNA polymerase sigma factor (sigma-70 family)